MIKVKVESMISDLAGRTIAKVRHDYSLKLWTDNNWELGLAGPAILSTRDADLIEIDTTLCQDELAEGAGPLVGAAITAVSSTSSGDLLISMGERRLRVDVAQDYEAWQISGPNGEKIICMPGGELAVWGPRVESVESIIQSSPLRPR